MGNFTELFNGCHAANDMAKFYLENAEKNAYTDFQTSMMNVRLAIEVFNNEIPHLGTIADYRRYIQQRGNRERAGLSDMSFDDFKRELRGSFYQNMPYRRDRSAGSSEGQPMSSAHNLAFCCYFLYNNSRAALCTAKRIIYIYAYACKVAMHAGATQDDIENLETYAYTQSCSVDFSGFIDGTCNIYNCNKVHYLVLLHDVLKRLLGSDKYVYFEPDLIPINEWILCGDERIKIQQYLKYITRSGIYYKENGPTMEYAMITLYDPIDESVTVDSIIGDLNHFFGTYNRICGNQNIITPHSSRTDIKNITTNNVNRIILYQYFYSKPLHINDDLVNDTSFSVVDRVKIAIGIGNIINNLHEKDIYIRTLTNESFLLTKNDNEYIPYITGLMEAKDLAADYTVINNAIQSFIDMGVYCAPWVSEAPISSYDTMDWRQADIYSYAVFLSYLFFGNYFTCDTQFDDEEIMGDNGVITQWDIDADKQKKEDIKTCWENMLSNNEGNEYDFYFNLLNYCLNDELRRRAHDA